MDNHKISKIHWCCAAKVEQLRSHNIKNVILKEKPE